MSIRAPSNVYSHLLTAVLPALWCAGCGGGSSSAAAPAVSTPTTPACADQSSARMLSTVDATITVDASSDLGAASPLIGFNHGIAAPSGSDYDFPSDTAARIAALKPSLWRVSDSRHYLKAKTFATHIMYSTSDEYFNYQAIYYPWNDTGTTSGSFDDWRNFDDNTQAVMQRSLAQAQPVDYWNLLNEPQFSQYNATDQQRLLDTYRHGYHAIKDGQPDQKVVAPTTLGYNPLIMQPLLDFAVANNLKFDAIDWHEIGTRPEDVIGHADHLRTLLAARPTLGNPPIIIDEYASPEHHHLPGFAVAWFHYLEKAGVLYAGRSCWNVTDAVNGLWSNCWNGLDGLFMRDNLTPQPLYWVFERYAQMLGRQLATTSSAPTDVVALASSSALAATAAGETKILAGRFVSDITRPSAPARSVAVNIQGLPTASSCVMVDIQRIPYAGPDVDPGADPTALALAATENVDRYTALAVGGKVTAYLPQFRDRDAYYISVK